MAAAKLPLDGIKVADFSWFGAGPICAEHLATFGATVVRVESETRIDALRTVQPFARDKTGYNVSGYFNNYNAGKLDLTLNMNTERGHGLAQRLVAWADVFLTNLTPRVVERWCLTYDKVSAVNPQIIAALPPPRQRLRSEPPRTRPAGRGAAQRLQVRAPQSRLQRPRRRAVDRHRLLLGRRVGGASGGDGRPGLGGRRRRQGREIRHS